MNKFTYPLIICKKLKSWLKFYIYKKTADVLPLGYQKLKYIEGNNSGYIPTDIYLSGDDTIKMKFKTLPTGTTTCCIFGAYKSGEDVNFSLYSAGATYYAYWRYAGTLYQNHKFQLDTMNNIEMNARIIKVNDDTYNTTFTESTFTTSRPIYIGHINASASPKIKGKIYSFEVVGKHKLVPALKTATEEVGLYDKMTDTFYPAERNNDGTRRIEVKKDFYFFLLTKICFYVYNYL